MLYRIVERDRAIEMRSSFRRVSGAEQRHPSEAMPNHEGDRPPMLLCERQELRRESANGIAIECHVVRYPEGVANLEQQQRIFRRLSQRFSLLDQQTRLLRSRPSFRRGIALGVHQGVGKSDLELDLLPTQRPRAGQGRDLLEGAS
jgi:hypothetical protein